MSEESWDIDLQIRNHNKKLRELREDEQDEFL